MDDLIATVNRLTLIISLGMSVLALLLVAVGVVALRIKVQSDQHGDKLEQLVHQFNSKMDQLLEAKRAEGVREGEGGRGPAVPYDAPRRPTGI